MSWTTQMSKGMLGRLWMKEGLDSLHWWLINRVGDRSEGCKRASLVKTRRSNSVSGCLKGSKCVWEGPNGTDGSNVINTEHGRHRKQIGRGRWVGRHRRGRFQHIQSIPPSTHLPIQMILGTHTGLPFGLKMVPMNARSVNNKSHLIHDSVTGEAAGLACIAETWLGNRDNVNLSPLCPQVMGYGIACEQRGSEVVSLWSIRIPSYSLRNLFGISWANVTGWDCWVTNSLLARAGQPDCRCDSPWGQFF